MAKYTKILGWVGPIILPIVIAGVRSLLKNRRRSSETGAVDESAPGEDMIEELVNAGLKGFSKGRGMGPGR